MERNNSQARENDLRAIQRCLSGNPNAFEELVVRYQKPVYNLAYRLLGNTEDAKDITQETFVKAYQSLHTHNPELKFSSWLFRIAHNLSIDQLRWKKLRQHVSIDAEFADDSDSYEGEMLQREIADEAPDARTVLSGKQKSERILRVMNSLPEKYRTVIILRHIEDLSLEEIAQVLQLPVGTVKTNLFRARMLMKEKLGNESR